MSIFLYTVIAGLPLYRIVCLFTVGSPSNDSLISRLDVVNLVDVGDDKTNNKIDDEYEGG